MEHNMEHAALIALKDAAPEHSPLIFDWEGPDPREWRARIKNTPDGSIADL